MVTLFEQFLGTEPGTRVEIIDKSSTPYRLKSEDGFEFLVSEDDFHGFYRELGLPTPKEWEHFVTDPVHGFVEYEKIHRVLEVINTFETVFHNFQKARDFVGRVLRTIGTSRSADPSLLEPLAAEFGITSFASLMPEMTKIVDLDDITKQLLLDDTLANVRLPIPAPKQDSLMLQREEGIVTGLPPLKRTRETPPQASARGMKNVVMRVEEDMLTITIDLAQEFGPSRSGKTTIVATTEGNKPVPGRDHRIGLTVYRTSTGKARKGSKKSFKNVVMDLEGATLTLTVDLKQEYGASRSGKTVIVASTEGNQLVFGREERIGLNVYRKIES